MKKQRNVRGHVKTVAVCAFLAVLGFVLDRFLGISIPLFGMTSLMVNISYIPIFMAGILYGPVWGALVGGVQDILCMILVPLGAPIWGITLTTMLAGAMAGFFGRFVLKITAENRGELLVPLAEERKTSPSFYLFGAVFVGILCSSLVGNSMMRFTIGETVHEIGIWDILMKSTAYKEVFIDVAKLYPTGNLPETFYSWLNLSDMFGSMAALFVAAIPLTIMAIYFSRKRKNILAILTALLAILSSGLGLIMVINTPKVLKELALTFQFGLSPYLAPLACCGVMIMVLSEADMIKFKLSAFCAVTAIATSVLNSFWLSMAYEKGVFVYLPIRLATALVISTPVYSFLLYYLLVKAKWLKKLV